MSGAFIKELRRPGTVIGICTALATTLIGLGFSIYFYKKSIRLGEISFLTEQVQVFNVENLHSDRKSDDNHQVITVLDSSGKIIRENVYAANISIWNSGNAEIKPDSVREIFSVNVSDDAKILTIDPTQFSGKNSNNFFIDKHGVFNWTHFDPGEGFKVNILYTADMQKEIKVVGKAVDYKRISDKGRFRLDRKRDVKTTYYLLLFNGLDTLALLLFFVEFRNRRTIIGLNARLRSSSLNFIGSLVALIGLFISISGYFFVRFYLENFIDHIGPPF